MSRMPCAKDCAIFAQIMKVHVSEQHASNVPIATLQVALGCQGNLSLSQFLVLKHLINIAVTTNRPFEPNPNTPDNSFAFGAPWHKVIRVRRSKPSGGAELTTTLRSTQLARARAGSRVGPLHQ